jgi:putative salt-induced outer membrane protein YdiY
VNKLDHIAIAVGKTTNRLARTTVFAALVVMVPLITQAQPPAAPPGTPPPPPPAQEATAEFAFVGTSGNSSTQSIGLSGEYINRPDDWTLTTKATYVRNESASELKAESFDFGFKGARALGPRLSAFGTYGYLHDRFAGIEHRHNIAGGVSYVLVRASPHTLTVDGSLGYARETPVLGAVFSNPVAETGALYKLKISETAELSEDGRFVFSLSDGNDWRASNVASVTAKLMTRLSLKASNTVRFVNAPVPGFKQTDTITAIALVLKF